LAMDRAWGEVDRPVGHGDKSPRIGSSSPFTMVPASC
jgi:hypothetical protein